MNRAYSSIDNSRSEVHYEPHTPHSFPKRRIESGTHQRIQCIKLCAVKLTGELFVVQYIDKRAQRVYTFGDVIRYQGVQLQHECDKSTWKSFPLCDVSINTIPLTVEIAKQLFDQTIIRRQREGRVLVKRGDKVFDTGKGLKSVNKINAQIQDWSSRISGQSVEKKKIG